MGWGGLFHPETTHCVCLNGVLIFLPPPKRFSDLFICWHNILKKCLIIQWNCFSLWGDTKLDQPWDFVSVDFVMKSNGKPLLNQFCNQKSNFFAIYQKVKKASKHCISHCNTAIRYISFHPVSSFPLLFMAYEVQLWSWLILLNLSFLCVVLMIPEMTNPQVAVKHCWSRMMIWLCGNSCVRTVN